MSAERKPTCRYNAICRDVDGPSDLRGNEGDCRIKALVGAGLTDSKCKRLRDGVVARSNIAVQQITDESPN